MTTALEYTAEATTAEGNFPAGKTGNDRAMPTVSSAKSSLSQSAARRLGPEGGRMIFGSRTLSSLNDPITISKITPALVPSPVYELRSGPQKKFQPRDWLEIEIEFSARRPFQEGLVFRVEVQIDRILFTGDVAVASLEKGENLLTVAYLSPGALRRAFRGRPANFEEGLRIQVVAVSASDGEKIFSASYEKGGAFAPIEREFENAVLAKFDTPFAPLYWDRYVDAAVTHSSEALAK